MDDRIGTVFTSLARVTFAIVLVYASLAVLDSYLANDWLVIGGGILVFGVVLAILVDSRSR